MTNLLVNYWNFLENRRHNQSVEGETYRSNYAREMETHRHNVMSEQLQSAANYNSYLSIQESIRHNQAYEEEQTRHNAVTESQTDSRLPYQNNLDLARSYSSFGLAGESAGFMSMVMDGNNPIDQSTIYNKSFETVVTHSSSSSPNERTDDIVRVRRWKTQ